jgi:hypothetical protein
MVLASRTAKAKPGNASYGGVTSIALISPAKSEGIYSSYEDRHISSETRRLIDRNRRVIAGLTSRYR